MPGDGGVPGRLGRIAGKLSAARATPPSWTAFGAREHRFELRAPLSEDVVAEFEARHDVALPPEYRIFLTELGDGGAGPGYGLRPLADSCGPSCRPGHLAQASPYLPGPRYLDDWEQRYEEPPGPDRTFLRGTLRIADHGCSLFTQLVVTGPARGRLFNLDDEGPVGPYVVEDADFLAWYERWLDETVAGYDTGWFGERLPLDELALLAALAADPSPERRARAGTSLLMLSVVSDAAWAALARAVATDSDAGVRAELLDALIGQGRDPRPAHPGAAGDEVARYARSSAPVDLRALALLRRLTLDDLLPELANHDPERRRRAAYLLAWDSSEIRRRQPPRGLLDGVVRRLLDAPDPLLRSHGVAVVRWFGLTHLHSVLHDLRGREQDFWVLHHLRWCLAEPSRPTADGYDDPWASAPPF
ncbi:hypothetical protein [Plantactinospora sp. B24E8]|uniref:hypothetical protein n=1 Tax=Plantactinospora sp. B24E8 TaxID=3153567 RepID=UPI00325F82C2